MAGLMERAVGFDSESDDDYDDDIYLENYEDILTLEDLQRDDVDPEAIQGRILIGNFTNLSLENSSKKAEEEQVIVASTVTEDEKKKKPPKPGSKAWIKANAAEKEKREAAQHRALADYHERTEMSARAKHKAMLESDFFMTLSDSLRETLANAVESEHARARREERGVEWSRFMGALRIKNKHNKVIGLASEFRNYGNIKVTSLTDTEIQIVLTPDSFAQTFTIICSTTDNSLFKYFHCETDRLWLLDGSKSLNISKPVVYSRAIGDNMAILLDPEDHNKRKRFANKKITFGKDLVKKRVSNPDQLHVIVSYNLKRVITMYYNR
jgi:hypothetical protein